MKINVLLKNILIGLFSLGLTGMDNIDLPEAYQNNPDPLFDQLMDISTSKTFDEAHPEDPFFEQFMNISAPTTFDDNDAPLSPTLLLSPSYPLLSESTETRPTTQAASINNNCCIYPQCNNRALNNIKSLNVHIQKHHIENGTFTCPVLACTYSNKQSVNLLYHYKVTHAQETLESVSSDQLSLLSKLIHNFSQAHLIKKFRTPMNEYYCPYLECNPMNNQTDSFNSLSNLHDHLRQQHCNSANKYPCPWPACTTQVVKGGSHLAIHMRAHINEQPYRCNIQGCTYAFVCNTNLIQHQKKHCAVCSRFFSKASQLQQHRATCTGEAHEESLSEMNTTHTAHELHEQQNEESNISQPIMTQQEVSLEVLSALIRNFCEIHLPSNLRTQHIEYRCPYASCTSQNDDPWDSKKALISHMNHQHCLNRQYECPWPNCSKILNGSAFNLATHLRTHINEQPYKCNILACTAAFISKNNLTTHQKKHHCPQCNGYFPQVTDLRKHQAQCYSFEND